ncbi:MAG: condensation domain-containing protein, partial [Bacillota bacterium]
MGTNLRSNVEDIISLTSMQEGMLFHYLMEPDSPKYHEQISVCLVGNVNPDVLQKAWDFVVKKNEMLRTVYRWKNIEKPVQIILKSHDVSMRHYDFSKEDPATKEKLLEGIRQADLKDRIDLETETLRIYLCKNTKNEYTMVVSNHHILYDGWSNAIIIRELLEAYNALYKGLTPESINKSKFKEFVKWSKSQDKARQKAYWANYLYSAEQNDVLFGKIVSHEMKNHKLSFSRDASNKIREFAKATGVSLASILYCAWGILVQKLNNADDIMFGTTISGRSHDIKGIENMVGLFINTIPLRVQTGKEESTVELLIKINEAIKKNSEYESTPLVDIKEYVGINNNSQLFNSLVVIENYPLNLDANTNEILTIKNYSAVERTNFNMTLVVTVLDTIEIDFQYNCFADDCMIERIGQYFENVISAVVSDKVVKIGDIDILTEEERNE